MSAPLTRQQKAYLAQLAAKAYKAECVRRGQEPDAGTFCVDVNEWRHEQVAKATGKLGLRCCTQDDYGAIKARFLALLDQEGRALRADLHGDPAQNKRRQALWKIDQELKRLGKVAAYAEGICKRMFHGLSLEEVPEKALWKVFYALRYQKGGALGDRALPGLRHG